MDLRKMLRKAGEDMAADMGGAVDDSMAYDMAGCMLEDPEIYKAAKKLWPGKSKAILQEIMADCI